MNNYMEVPNVISTKDLSYLSDMFEWNYVAHKCTYNSIDKVSDSEIKSMLEEGSNLFKSNMNDVLNILGGTNE